MKKGKKNKSYRKPKLYKEFQKLPPDLQLKIAILSEDNREQVLSFIKQMNEQYSK